MDGFVVLSNEWQSRKVELCDWDGQKTKSKERKWIKTWKSGRKMSEWVHY